MSESTTTRNFRSNLKEYFDMARDEPIAINRSDERYILLHEKEYLKMKEEISNLQKSLISALQVQNGQYEEIDLNEEGDKLLDDYLEKNKDKLKKQKGA